MTWTWKWNTVCHAARPHEFNRLTPSAPRRSETRPASRRAAAAQAARSSSDTSSRSRLCSRGTTSACPRVAGLMSMNAMVRSSWSTIVDETSPATMLQNRQSGSRATARELTRPQMGLMTCPTIPRAWPSNKSSRVPRPVTRDSGQLEAAIRHLAAIPRPSASEGEREAAEWLADELRAAGCRDVRVEQERAHGTYWWPLGLLTGVAALGGLAALRGRRLAGVLAGAFAAAGVAGDVGGGSLWFRRRVLPHRSTWNVVAEAGDPDAPATVVFVGHHDAAHSGLLFHPAIPRFIADHFPQLLERSDTTAPVMFPVFGGAAAVALGAALGIRTLLRAGTFLSAGSVASFADIGARSVGPGANDNPPGSGPGLGPGQALPQRPVEGGRGLP